MSTRGPDGLESRDTVPLVKCRCKYLEFIIQKKLGGGDKVYFVLITVASKFDPQRG